LCRHARRGKCRLRSRWASPAIAGAEPPTGASKSTKPPVAQIHRNCKDWSWPTPAPRQRLQGGDTVDSIRSRAMAAFTAAILACVLLLPGGALAQSKPSGVYKGNGTPAALTQVVAYRGERESGKPVTVLVFSAKSQAGSSKPPFDALFN